MGLAVACAGDFGFVFGGVIAALLFFIFVARYALATTKVFGAAAIAAPSSRFAAK